MRSVIRGNKGRVSGRERNRRWGLTETLSGRLEDSRTPLLYPLTGIIISLLEVSLTEIPVNVVKERCFEIIHCVIAVFFTLL